VWRREVVLVGDAAENPAGSTAGRPQLRGLTRQASSARPAAQSVPMAAFCRRRGQRSTLSVRSGRCKTLVWSWMLAMDAWAGRRDFAATARRRQEMLRGEAARSRAETGAWKMQALSVAVPRDGWWRSSGGTRNAHPRAALRPHNLNSLRAWWGA
jgi:hypothetical protein